MRASKTHSPQHKHPLPELFASAQEGDVYVGGVRFTTLSPLDSTLKCGMILIAEKYQNRGDTMNIQMLGIDYEKAGIDERAKFSFTKKDMENSLNLFKKQQGILGVVILSTCNRMEVWVSVNEKYKDNLYDVLCQIKQVEPDKYYNLFQTRKGKEAVKHLFTLSAGLKSQILGEDQILTQVKEALAFSRENYCTDNVLEVLFRKAITAAKRVKTEVVLSKSNQSVIHKAVEMLQQTGLCLQNKCCMVIGNGEMGRLTGELLMEQGADVTVTVRQYHSGIVNIPLGCKRINYGERQKFLPECDFIISATSSPNCTITKEMIEHFGYKKGLILIDLAVPRDIEPSIKEMKDITMYDIDDFQGRTLDEKQKRAVAQAKDILRIYKKEFYDWYEGRDIVHTVDNIKKETAADVNLRLTKVMKKTSLDKQEKEKLAGQIEHAVENTMGKLMFELKSQISEEAYLECIQAMEKILEK